MKNLGFIAVVALLMMFGCSKDNLIVTEQDSIVVDENNQTIINGERGSTKGATSPGAIMSFGSTSISNINNFKWTQEKGDPYPIIELNRILMLDGTFSGKLGSYGRINSSLSYYKFNSPELVPIDSPPNYGEPEMVSVISEGKIYINISDYCSITMTGNVYPWYYSPETNSWLSATWDGGLFIGTATINGYGKLSNLNNKKFSVYSNNIGSPGINLETGAIRLDFSDYEYLNGIKN